MKFLRPIFYRFNLKNESGQGLTEYAVVLSLVAVAAIATTALFGGAIKSKISSIAGAVSGNKDQKEDAEKLGRRTNEKLLEQAKKKTSMKIEDSQIESEKFD